MRTISGSARLAATPAEVYAFLSDPANLPTWQTGVRSSVRTSPPPTVTGSTGRVVIEVMGQRATADTIVREAIPDRRLVLATKASGMSVVGTLDLRPDGDGTRITFSSEIKAESIFMAPLEGMVADFAAKDVEASLARLDAALQAARSG